MDSVRDPSPFKVAIVDRHGKPREPIAHLVRPSPGPCPSPPLPSPAPQHMYQCAGLPVRRHGLLAATDPDCWVWGLREERGRGALERTPLHWTEIRQGASGDSKPTPSTATVHKGMGVPKGSFPKLWAMGHLSGGSPHPHPSSLAVSRGHLCPWRGLPGLAGS